MLISSGKHKGRKIHTSKMCAAKPTSGLMKQSIINILKGNASLYPKLDGAIVADIFCGFGGMGFEMLSNGAESVFFVNNAHKEIQCIKQTVEDLSAKESVSVIKTDAGNLTKLPKTCNIIFLDPPYREIEVLVKFLLNFSWLENLQKDHIIIIELHKRAYLKDHLPDCFKIQDERVYGSSKIMLLRFISS